MLLQRVRQFVRQHALFRPDSRVVVALSGGSDSVALAVVLRDLASAGDVRLVGAAHFNHELRDHAKRDEVFAASVSQWLGIGFLADRADIRARARRDRQSIEDAARQARYEFFARARKRFGADAIALGHTRDDQAETFLLRLVRGAGPRGLAGIHPRHGTVVRPLLDCSRAELRAFLTERDMAWVEDETNDDVSIPRNRVRAELLPLLAERFNPAIVDVLAREAELSRELWGWLESLAEKGVGSLVRRTSRKKASDGVFEIDVERLKALPAPLRRVLLWRMMNEAAGGERVGFSHVEGALRLLGREGGGEEGGIDAPGHRVERLAKTLVLTRRRQDTRGGRRANLFTYPLSIPGEVRLAEAGYVVTAEVPSGSPVHTGPERAGRGPRALVRRDLCTAPLAVRNRRPGDRFRPVGLGGRKKLQDYFVDRKVARTGRDLVPLVVDGAGRIVWVAGYGIDETFRVTDPSQSVLLLRLRQV
jgi:tRNA(Ile)-lysidine synthase